MKTRSLWRAISLGAVFALAPTDSRSQQVIDGRVRYEFDRATVVFEADAFGADLMGRFATLANRGVMDVERLLDAAPAGNPPRRITFFVRDDIPISRSFRRTVMLPADRVRRDAAPYLHETTHILVPMRQECLWLSEGFASYVQSYVAENVGGYDGYVFSWGGNRNIDRLARRTLASEGGQRALPFVGVCEEPADVFEKRREVAQPLYVLSHGLVKYMVEQTSLAQVKALVQSADIAASAPAITGKSIEAWKKEWLAR